jgi:hypothetical protein
MRMSIIRYENGMEWTGMLVSSVHTDLWVGMRVQVLGSFDLDVRIDMILTLMIIVA